MKNEFLGAAAGIALICGAAEYAAHHQTKTPNPQTSTPEPTASQEKKTIEISDLLILAHEAYLIVNPSGISGADAGAYMVDENENLWSFYEGVNVTDEDTFIQIYKSKKDGGGMTRYSIKLANNTNSIKDIIEVSEYGSSDPNGERPSMCLTDTGRELLYNELERAIANRLSPQNQSSPKLEQLPL